MDQRLREAWHARERAFPIYPVLHLASEGLILGAGTVLVPAQEARQLTSLDGREARVLALLSAAYGKAVAPAVLGNIARAADAWRRGDDCLAYIHLAHSRLPELQDSYEAARRLFLAEGFLEAGGNPRGVLEALNLDAAHIDAIEKVYNPAEPRVPAGSGRTSGQWTRLLSVLGDLSAEAAEQLESFALRLLGASLSEGAAAAAAFGLLFIPSPNDLSVEGEVAGLPGLSYAWNCDESTLHLTYDNPDGGRSTFSAQLEDDVFRDERGQIIGRVLPDGTIAIDTAAVSADLAQDDQPKLCPAPGPDHPGGSEIGRDYEDYVKSIVNPDNPTPRGWGYQLPNPEKNGNPVYFDGLPAIDRHDGGGQGQLTLAYSPSNQAEAKIQQTGLTSPPRSSPQPVAARSGGISPNRRQRRSPKNSFGVPEEVAIGSKLRFCPGRGAGHEHTLSLRAQCGLPASRFTPDGQTSVIRSFVGAVSKHARHPSSG